MYLIGMKVIKTLIAHIMMILKKKEIDGLRS